MCERLDYWKRLSRALIGEISSPLSEIVWGGVGAFVFMRYAIRGYGSTMNMRVVFALLVVPSFLMLIHGMHRGLPAEEA